MIYLCYPSKIVGGAEHLMLKTALLLSENGFKVCIVDRKNGWLSQHILELNSNIRIITITIKKILLLKDDVLIVPASFFYKVDDYFYASDARVILWVIQINNLIMRVPDFIRKKTLQNFLQKYINEKTQQHILNIQHAIDNNGVAIMDAASAKGLIQSYNISLDKYLPLFIDMQHREYDSNDLLNINKSTIHALWLGRVDNGFKIHILCKLISDLSLFQLKNNKDIILTIIGEGEGTKDLRKYAAQYTNLSINFLGTLEYNKLKKYIKDSDIGFAMGTSALDIASYGIPTVLLDFSYEPIQNCRYRWIFESENYSLGREIKRLSQLETDQMHTMDDIFLSLSQHYKDLSKQSYQYVKTYHSNENISNLLIDYMQKSSLKISDLYKYRCSKPFWVYVSSLYVKLRGVL